MRLEAEYSIEITHPSKMLWPGLGITKREYIEYLIHIAPFMLPHLKGRPLTMIRYPDGISGHSFYQRNLPQGAPSFVQTYPIWSADRNDTIHYVLVDSISTLLWLGNLGCLEFHVGYATTDAPDEPTAIAFDLDPNDVSFEAVRETALAIHDILLTLGIPHVGKTSGATGFQIFIPLTARHTYEQTRIFTTTIAKLIHTQMPELVTLERLTKNRGRKVYIDYPQHGRQRTLIAPYSPRATQHATVSAPVSFEELQDGILPEDFTLRNMVSRCERFGDIFQTGDRIDLSKTVDLLQQTYARKTPHA